MSIYASLLIEGLFADVAILSIGKLLVAFEFESRNILDVWGCMS
jgi:hypothetical protein